MQICAEPGKTEQTDSLRCRLQQISRDGRLCHLHYPCETGGTILSPVAADVMDLERLSDRLPIHPSARSMATF